VKAKRAGLKAAAKYKELTTDKGFDAFAAEVDSWWHYTSECGGGGQASGSVTGSRGQAPPTLPILLQSRPG
jgi:hypothetical protein